MKQCPDCDKPVPEAAVTCRCGFKFPALEAIDSDHIAARDRIECVVTPGCQRPAVLRRRMPDGQFANSCRACDAEAVRLEAEEALAARGLGRKIGESAADYRKRLVASFTRQGGLHFDMKRFPVKGDLPCAQNVNGAFTEPGKAAPEAGGQAGG